MSPNYLIRRAMCAWRGHDPFPRNAAAHGARARCWRCGDVVTVR